MKAPVGCRFGLFVIFWALCFSRFFREHWLLAGAGAAALGFVSLVLWDSWRGRREEREMRRRFEAEDQS